MAGSASTSWRRSSSGVVGRRSPRWMDPKGAMPRHVRAEPVDDVETTILGLPVAQVERVELGVGSRPERLVPLALALDRECGVGRGEDDVGTLVGGHVALGNATDAETGEKPFNILDQQVGAGVLVAGRPVVTPVLVNGVRVVAAQLRLQPVESVQHDGQNIVGRTRRPGLQDVDETRERDAREADLAARTSLLVAGIEQARRVAVLWRVGEGLQKGESGIGRVGGDAIGDALDELRGVPGIGVARSGARRMAPIGPQGAELLDDPGQHVRSDLDTNPAPCGARNRDDHADTRGGHGSRRRQA